MNLNSVDAMGNLSGACHPDQVESKELGSRFFLLSSTSTIYVCIERRLGVEIQIYDLVD